MHSDNFLTISQVMRMLPVKTDFENCLNELEVQQAKGSNYVPLKNLVTLTYPFSGMEVSGPKKPTWASQTAVQFLSNK